MTRSETRELDKLKLYRSKGIGPGYVALSLSALIRATRSSKTAAELRALAELWGITQHPDFII